MTPRKEIHWRFFHLAPVAEGTSCEAVSHDFRSPINVGWMKPKLIEVPLRRNRQISSQPGARKCKIMTGRGYDN